MNLMLFTSLLNLSIFMGTSTNNIIFTWMMMEMNMITFIPMMYYYNKPSKKDIFMKYFLIQSFSSSIMLISMLFYFTNSFNSIFISMMLISILMKTGMWPFSWWYMHLLINLDWMTIFIMMTSQKMLPFYLFYNLMDSSNIYSPMFMHLLQLILLLNLISSFFMIINSNLIKLIISASSMNQMTWFFTLLFYNCETWSNYFSLYTFTLLITMTMFNFYEINFIHDLHILPLPYKILLMTLMIFFMMLPPTMNFFMKLLAVKNIMIHYHYLLTFIMLCLSTIFSFFYLKILFPSILFFKMNNFFNTHTYTLPEINLILMMLLFILTSLTVLI
uniref:NADH-ubiquinone oxidoreductase chain 2 n=1 Tax=Leptopilina myrica (nomen nudum) TaxID=2964900 RepID=A0AAU7BNX2_9HYME